MTLIRVITATNCNTHHMTGPNYISAKRDATIYADKWHYFGNTITCMLWIVHYVCCSSAQYRFSAKFACVDPDDYRLWHTQRSRYWSLPLFLEKTPGSLPGCPQCCERAPGADIQQWTPFCLINQSNWLIQLASAEVPCWIDHEMHITRFVMWLSRKLGRKTEIPSKTSMVRTGGPRIIFQMIRLKIYHFWLLVSPSLYSGEELSLKTSDFEFLFASIIWWNQIFNFTSSNVPQPCRSAGGSVSDVFMFVCASADQSSLLAAQVNKWIT